MITKTVHIDYFIDSNLPEVDSHYTCNVIKV